MLLVATKEPNLPATFLISNQTGQSEAQCVVEIEDDRLHEKPEEFRLVLGTPTSESAGKARLGNQDEILVTINDDADRKYCSDPPANWFFKEF